MRESLEFIQYQGQESAHTHEHTQIVLPLYGQLELEIGGQANRLDVGQAALIASDVRHTYMATAENNCLVLNALASWSSDSSCADPFVALSSATTSLFPFLRKMSLMNTQPEIRDHLLGLLSNLLPLPSSEASLKVLDRRLEKAVSLMTHHLANQWSMAELADQVHLSQSQLTQLFRRQLGVTPRQYLVKMRVKKAKELIMDNPSHSLDQVAELVGSGDASNLIRQFHKHLGVSPSQFKK